MHKTQLLMFFFTLRHLSANVHTSLLTCTWLPLITVITWSVRAAKIIHGSTISTFRSGSLFLC